MTKKKQFLKDFHLANVEVAGWNEVFSGDIGKGCITGTGVDQELAILGKACYTQGKIGVIYLWVNVIAIL